MPDLSPDEHRLYLDKLKPLIERHIDDIFIERRFEAADDCAFFS